MSAGAQVWEHFLSLVKRARLIGPADTLVVGVSGGPDSLCLLHVLRRLREERFPELQLIVAHLNHRIRSDAEEDARFVAKLAQQWGLPCVVGEADVPALAQRPGLSLEEAARIARYRFLKQIALLQGAGAIAVGHHADDQVETIVMHWLRGSGLAGLRGMSPRSLMSEWHLKEGDNETKKEDVPAGERDIALIRPLLECTRAEIMAYCVEQALEPRYDLSNIDTTIYRNRLRHELLPFLETFNPNIREVLRRSAIALARDFDYLHGVMRKEWERLAVVETERDLVRFPLEEWRALHPSLQAALLREAIRCLRRGLRNINWVHIETAMEIGQRGRLGHQSTLPQGLMLTVGRAELWIAGEKIQAEREQWPSLASESIDITIPGLFVLGEGWTIHVNLCHRRNLPEGWEHNMDPWVAYVALEKLVGRRLSLRKRRPGDRFCPLGMEGKKKSVREFMNAVKLPAVVREKYPLLIAGDEIVWLPGLRLDDRFRVQGGTERVVIIRMEKLQGS